MLLLYFGQLAWQVQVLHPQGYYRVLDSNNGSPARFQLMQRASTEDEGTVIVGGPGQPFRWILPVDITGSTTSLTYTRAACSMLSKASCALGRPEMLLCMKMLVRCYPEQHKC